jgi:hypothetical protein
MGVKKATRSNGYSFLRQRRDTLEGFMKKLLKKEGRMFHLLLCKTMAFSSAFFVQRNQHRSKYIDKNLVVKKSMAQPNITLCTIFEQKICVVFYSNLRTCAFAP